MYRSTTSFTTKDYDVRPKQILEDNFTTQEEIDEFLRIGYIEVYDDTLEITENGEYDVEDYITADVNVPSGEPTLQSKTVTITENGTTTVQADSGYDALSSVEVDVDVPSGSQFVFNNPNMSGLNEVVFPIMEKVIKAYVDYVDTQIPIYLSNPITIYTPDVNMQNFIINKRYGSNEYRIIWTNGKFSYVAKSLYGDTGNVGLLAQIQMSNRSSYNIQMPDLNAYWTTNGFAASIGVKTSTESLYSKSFDSLADLLEAITNPNSEMNYQNPNNSSLYNDDYTFTKITNTIMWTKPNSESYLIDLAPIRKLSNNITILPLS